MERAADKGAMTDAAADCSLCAGTGMRISRDAQGDRVAAVCSCRIARQALRRLERANIPRRHEHATLSNYESIIAGAGESMLHAHFKANKFVEDYPHGTDGRGLMFVGLAGRGKTHLAVGVLRALIEEKGCQGLFCDYGDLLKQIQNSYNSRAETTEYALLRPVLEAEVLVLDDLGSTKPTAWVWDTVAHLLNGRYNHKRTTIITTNFSNRPPAAGGKEDTLGDRIGERMRSRLAEMCVCLEVLGEDFRQTAGAARFAWSEAEWFPGSS
ncbi:MAG TPA: ATP-binding protein [Acidobacteriaceae bacterium]|nr:ATP-binding protein [Acidobacteriaceae bacterium]